MIRSLASAAVAILAFGAVGVASAAQVTQTVTTTASPDAVWGVIGSFDAISNWLPGAVSSPADKGDKIGSTRVITLKAPGDPTITEKLTALDEAKHSYSYKIVKVDPKVVPVSGYTSTIMVVKSGEGSKVTWKGSFSPAGGADAATAEKAITGIYRGGLDQIKVMAEKK